MIKISSFFAPVFLLVFATLASFATADMGDILIKSDNEPNGSLANNPENAIKLESKKLFNQVKRLLIYTHSSCVKCDEAKAALSKNNVEYQDVDLTWNRKQKSILSSKAGKDDVSYVFIGNKYIGNHEDLISMLKRGKLLEMLEGK